MGTLAQPRSGVLGRRCGTSAGGTPEGRTSVRMNRRDLRLLKQMSLWLRTGAPEWDSTPEPVTGTTTDVPICDGCRRSN